MSLVAAAATKPLVVGHLGRDRPTRPAVVSFTALMASELVPGGAYLAGLVGGRGKGAAGHQEQRRSGAKQSVFHGTFSKVEFDKPLTVKTPKEPLGCPPRSSAPVIQGVPWPRLLEGSCRCGAVQFSVQSHAPYPYQLCYCSICRKTPGGGGFAINLHADKKSLKIRGKKAIGIFRAKIEDDDGHCHTSRAGAASARDAARRCGCSIPGGRSWCTPSPPPSTPAAGAADQGAPDAEFKAPWVKPDFGRGDARFRENPKLSIEEWHKKRGLWIDHGASAQAGHGARRSWTRRRGSRRCSGGRGSRGCRRRSAVKRDAASAGGIQHPWDHRAVVTYIPGGRPVQPYGRRHHPRTCRRSVPLYVRCRAICCGAASGMRG